MLINYSLANVRIGHAIYSHIRLIDFLIFNHILLGFVIKRKVKPNKI